MGQFNRYHGPVYWAIGSLSNSVEERKADLMAKYFSDFKMEAYEGRHHFDPRGGPNRNASQKHWRLYGNKPNQRDNIKSLEWT
jgi:hypothetical protein